MATTKLASKDDDYKKLFLAEGYEPQLYDLQHQLCSLATELYSLFFFGPQFKALTNIYAAD